MAEEEEYYEEGGNSGPKLPPDAQIASNIFHRENVDGILNREIGTYHALTQIMKMSKHIPALCAVRDILFLVENVNSEGDFIEETFITFFVECLNIVRQEFDGGEEEDGEEFAATPEFIADRLSDLQAIDGSDFAFNFTSFLVKNAELTNIDAITDFEALVNVSLKSNYLSDISPLAKLPRLKHLDLTENRVKMISQLTFPSLETLTLSKNRLVCIESVDAPRLKSIDVSGNKIFFIAPFAFRKCPELESINLSQNSIRVFREQCFGGLSHLKTLKLAENNFQTIASAISSNLTALADLDISSNPVQSLGGLDKCTSLEVLDIHQTAIEQPMDLSPLIDHCPVKYLYIFESPLAEFEMVRLELIHMLPELLEIDEEAVSVNDRQDSEQLFRERAEEEQRILEEQLMEQMRMQQEMMGEEEEVAIYEEAADVDQA